MAVVTKHLQQLYLNIIKDKFSCKNGVPDFSKYSYSQVQILSMTNNRTTNFKQADEALAEYWSKIKYNGQKSWTGRDVNYRTNNGLTLHEMNNMDTMQLVPSEIKPTWEDILVALKNIMQWLVKKEVLILIKDIDITIWGRHFHLNIDYDCFKGESVTNKQEEMIEKFINNLNLINESKFYVEKYCKKELDRDKTNEKKDNIFSYIKPDYLYIKREENPRIAIMCKYKYDLEHGLAIVFSDEGKIKIGLQDIIL